MRTQVVFKKRHFAYDRDWLDAFSQYLNAELVERETPLDADLIVIHHSMNGQWAGYPEWLVRECQKRRGKLVIFHANEFKDIPEKQNAAKIMGADFIATQMPDGRLYEIPAISLPHALNPSVFFDARRRRDILVGFRGAPYKPGINDGRNAVIQAFSGYHGCDIVMDKRSLYGRDEWAAFLNRCKATPGGEAGMEGARTISSRHIEAIGCGTLNILQDGEYGGVIDRSHYLTFTDVEQALEVVNDDRQRTEITERALAHLMSHHTYKHRIDRLLDAVWQNKTHSPN